MSKFRVAIALLIGGTAITMGYRAYQRSLLSPFSIGTVRPGMRFRDAQDEAQHEMKHGYACRVVGGHVQICELVSDGPIGVLKLVVDPSGRVALIQYRISDSSTKTQNVGRRTSQEWDRVHQAGGGSNGQEMNWSAWQTDDSLWSAEMWWRHRADVPALMTSTDARRLRRIATSSPAAFHMLVADSLLDRRDLARAPAVAPTTDEAPNALNADMHADADVDARGAASLPECSALLAPLRLARDTLKGGMEPALWAVAQQVIARGYPGMHLETTRRATWLIDASGAAQEIMLHPNASTATGDLYAFAVSFPPRLKNAAAHAGSFDAAHQCRATSEVLLARVDPATHRVASLQRIGVDDESLVNVISHLDFDPTADPPPRLIVEYLASYGTANWYGQVRWNELIAADSLRIMRRSPVSYGKKLPGGSAEGGPLLPDNNSPDDPYGFSYTPGTILHYSRLNLATGGRDRHITLSTGTDVLPTGWKLLSQL